MTPRRCKTARKNRAPSKSFAFTIFETLTLPVQIERFLSHWILVRMVAFPLLAASAY